MGPQLQVLARGEQWLVVDKPTGVSVRRQNRPTDEPDIMLSRVRALAGQEVYALNPISSAASGCMLFVLDKELVEPARAALTAGSTTDVALVRGHIQAAPTSTTISLSGVPGSDDVIAETGLQVLGSAADPRCALVLATPRTHHHEQVRRHLRRLGHPVLGDRKHGETGTNREWRERGLRRLFLHRARLTFDLGGPVEVVAPLPPALARTLETLPFAASAKAAAPSLLDVPAWDPIRVIDGTSYDSGMLDAVAAASLLRADGAITLDQAKRLFAAIQDGGEFSAIERTTLAYIRGLYSFTHKAERWFGTNLRRWTTSA